MEKRLIVIEVKQLGSIDSIHEYLQETLEFPDYYGKNLDALYDMLSDISGGVGIDVHVEEDTPKELKEYAKRLINVIKDAGCYV